MLRADAESISIAQDGCNGWLSVRYGATNANLETQFGMVGVAKISALKQVHALKIKQQTELILQNFCMPTMAMPLSKKKRKLALLESGNC